MLTYDALRGFATEERAKNAFVRLPEGFLAQAREYIQAKQQLDKQDEVATAKRLLQELLDARERKLLVAAFYFVRSGVKVDHLLPEEKALFERVCALLREFQEARTLPPAGDVEFLLDTPAFVGTDLQTYGPYKPGDRAPLPPAVASLLVQKGAAKLADAPAPAPGEQAPAPPAGRAAQ
ncbi:MAG: DNA replication complex GINS family protein [Candidatus Aenigmarchaeota archaeon]|nr:DNA replication complex GINS family protein [Candidatus Aenigmarchaeota archaeon]